jgi:hypothetical protein
MLAHPETEVDVLPETARWIAADCICNFGTEHEARVTYAGLSPKQACLDSAMIQRTWARPLGDIPEEKPDLGPDHHNVRVRIEVFQLGK